MESTVEGNRRNVSFSALLSRLPSPVGRFDWPEQNSRCPLNLENSTAFGDSKNGNTSQSTDSRSPSHQRHNGLAVNPAQLFQILRDLHRLIEAEFHERIHDLALPAFLISYGRTLKSHFIDKSVVILNVSRELLVGSALAAYILLTRQSLEPNRILFVTTNTDKLEVERFMKLWSVANVDDDDDDDVTMLMTQADLHALLKSTSLNL
jgi:hypothetical protein